jgi:hypothetical protein
MLQTYGNSFIELEVEDSLGNLSQVTVNSTMTLAAYADSLYSCSWCGPAYEITECGYGYVNMGKLQTWQVTPMYNMLQNTPAIIFDLRNYPNMTAWPIANKLFSGNAVFSRMHMAIPEFPGDYFVYMDNIGVSNNPTPYSGKIFILVNMLTQSQAEYSAMMLSVCPSASSIKTIGSPTSGGDGDVAQFYFPGNLRFGFSGTGVFYPDSTVTQRVGVHIDSLVVPTPEGLRNGEDEVLKAAFECLTGVEQPENPTMSFDVFPNPSSGSFRVSFHSDQGGESYVLVYDVNGQIVFETVHNTMENLVIDLSNHANGLYLVKATSGNSVISKKITIHH